MTRPNRDEVFSQDEVACVHVMNRAVRRCYLMGDDPISGKNFDHRKVWMETKLELHAANFGIDLLGYAILSNHFHLVLRSRPDVVAIWDDSEIARRWLMLCPERKNLDGTAKKPNEFELNSIRNDAIRVAEIRSRLSDFSWWMRLLCQHVGQRANRETNETGKFWESRFKAVRLLDETALLACVAYVDLNPIRAFLCQTLESSDFTSAKKRIEALLLATVDKPTGASSPDRSLAPVLGDERCDAIGPMPSSSNFRCSDKGFLNMTCTEYLELLDWTARNMVSGKGCTLQEAPLLLERLGLKQACWLALVCGFGKIFQHVAGQPSSIEQTRSLKSRARYRVQPSTQELFMVV